MRKILLLSIFFFTLIFTRSIIPTQFSFAQDTNWDHSHLVFDGSCGGDCTQIHATICNQGDADMAGTTTYQVWYHPILGPQMGSQIASGTVPALKKNECTILTYTPTQSGNYQFRVLQRPGYPGQNDCWSNMITIHECRFPSVTPSPTPQITPTSGPTPTVTPATTPAPSETPQPTLTVTPGPSETPIITLAQPSNTPIPTPNSGGGGGGESGGSGGGSSNSPSNELVQGVQQAVGEVLGASVPQTGLADGTVSEDAITGNEVISGVYLSIPRLNLKKPVYYAQYVGSQPLVGSDEILQMGTGTNKVFYGHNTAAVFMAIGYLTPGDTITYNNHGVDVNYIVDSVKTVNQEDTSILTVNNLHEITLITCDLNNPNLRTIVTAHEADSASI